VFVALSDKHVKQGGRIAFVLPITLATGEAWGKTRALIASRYHLETVVVSHDADRPNFSENTNLSELLFIARKLVSGEKPGETTYINLWRNPRSIHEALDLAARLVSRKPVSISGAKITSVRSGRGKLAEMVSAPAPNGEENWTGALFAQTELLRTLWHLERGQLRVPGVKNAATLKLCRLDDLTEIGPDYARIVEGFNVSVDEWSSYPGFWNHDSERVTSIQQINNCWLIPRSDSPRGPDYGAHLWERSGDILIVSRLRTNTQRLIAIGLPNRTLGNTWWALKCKDMNQEQRKCLLLWLNSSLSLLLYFGRRSITQSAWMQMKQPAWESMPVLNVHALSDTKIDELSATYDLISSQELQALSKLDRDPVRAAIDEAFCAALDLPDLEKLRELISREPGLTGKKITTMIAKEQISLFQKDEGEPQLQFR
jgi:hypothetical protein